MRLAHRDKTWKRLVDLDAAARFAAKEADAPRSWPNSTSAPTVPKQAIAQYSLWIATHPQDGHLAAALNGRCWSRTLTGRDLDKALADCNAAVKIYPKSPVMLDSRGLVRLRLGDFDKAIADYDASLNLRPKSAWSLYGRGLAELRKGVKAQGDADLAAATALQPGVADRAKKYGIGP